MNTKKINVLNKAIEMLEGGFEYSWHRVDQCNCGVVVRACGIGERNEALKATNTGDWRHGAERLNILGEKIVCKVTGLVFGAVQKILLEYGFSSRDLVHLEMLSDKDILEKAQIEATNYAHNERKENLILYLRAWVSILQEQDAKEQPKEPEVKERIVYVAVAETISKQAKELILS